MRRLSVLAASVAICSLALLSLGASTALAADSLQIQLSNPSPTRGIPITVTFSGADSPYDQNGDTPQLYALVRPANGIPCQSTFGADEQVSGSTGVTDLYDSGNNYDTVSSGNYSYQASLTPVAGSYIICAWLETVDDDYSGAGYTSSVVTATASTTYTTTSTDKLTISLPSPTPARGVLTTVTFSGSATPYDQNGDTPFLYALVRPANGISCQATFGADRQVAGSSGVTDLFDSGNNYNTVSSGNYSYQVSINPTVGSYVICAWLETVDDDDSGAGYTSSVVTATATDLYSVAAPVYCIVPRYRHTTKLAGMKNLLVSHHCGVGPVHWLREPHIPRGRVVGIGAEPGSRHSEGYRVAIWVSRGR